MSINTFRFSLPEDIAEHVNAAADGWTSNKKVTRVWEKDATVWTGDDESQWLGWLDIAREELQLTDQYRSFHEDITGAGLTDVLLMGMGGSSLCPEVLGITFGKRNFHILDSTVPARIAAIEGMIDLEKTLFIVSSKSGSTLEPNIFKQYFFERLSERVGRERAGRQFVAITDPGSKLEKVAKDDGFRYIFYGKPSIGGRFSALSAFGMAAGAAMGVDVKDLLERTLPMIDACTADDARVNPGAQLGTILGCCQRAGRDKLTIYTSAEIYDLGAWLEQLIAESTGKKDIAIIPVDREPIEETARYGSDRIFAFLSLEGDAGTDAQYEAFSAAGHPAVKIGLDSIASLGQEFFRWEFATAVAGSIMGINPFNQPDVETAKVEARKLTDEYEEKGKLPDETPFFSGEGFELFAGDEYAAKLTGSVTESSFASLLTAHLDNIGTGDYFAILAYVEMSSENERRLTEIREKVLRRSLAATCLGFGPRFLHSTGQAYKGGGNNGVFLQITSDDAEDISVPGQKYTFGVVKAAQARGDFQVLVDRGRRALRVHISSDVAGDLERIFAIIG